MDTNPYLPLLSEDLEDAGDYEGRLQVLRRFTQENQKRIRDRDLGGSLSLESVFLELSRLAEAVLEGSVRVARDELLNKGTAAPSGDGFAVVAMGKFGGRELTYHSDLDVMFFHENDQEFSTRLATRVLSALSVHTQDGIAYRIDAGLRPSGNSGVLVSSLNSFRDYHREIGRNWERQALIKARVAVPSDGSRFARELEETFSALAYQDGDNPTLLASEIDHLRGRMEREIAKERPGRTNLKTGRGGIVDIEFAVQYLQLVHGRARPRLRQRGTISALEALSEEGILDPGLAQRLKAAYLFYRELESRLRLMLDQSTDEIWEGSEIGRKMTERFVFKFSGDLPVFEALKRTREEVRRAYRSILKGDNT